MTRRSRWKPQINNRRDLALLLIALLAVPLFLVGRSLTSSNAALPNGPAATTPEPTPATSPKDEVNPVKLLAEANGPPVTVPRPKGRATKVLVVGDTISAGGDATKRSLGYVPRLQAWLNKRHPTAMLQPVEMGTGRTGTVGELPKGADVTIVAVGTTDYLTTRLPEFKRDYRTLIARVRAASPRTKLLCVSLWQSPKTQNAPKGAPPASYNTAISDRCVRGRYVFISDLFNVPGTHGPSGYRMFNGQNSSGYLPNDNGHSSIATAIEAALR